jgi:hypothetical protein
MASMEPAVRPGGDRLWRGTRPLRVIPLGQAAALWAWLLLVVIDAQDVLCPALRGSVHSRWVLAGIQLAVYLLLAAPLTLWSPRTLKLVRAPWWQIVLGMLAVAAALAHQAAGHLADTVQIGYLVITLAPAAFIEGSCFAGSSGIAAERRAWGRCQS